MAARGCSGSTSVARFKTGPACAFTSAVVENKDRLLADALGQSTRPTEATPPQGLMPARCRSSPGNADAGLCRPTDINVQAGRRGDNAFVHSPAGYFNLPKSEFAASV